MIRFACPKCDTSLKTADEKAGTKLLCPDCGEKVTVPAASAEKKGGTSTKTATVPKKTAAKTSPSGSSKATFIGIAVGACVLVAAGAGFFAWQKMTEKPKNEYTMHTTSGVSPVSPMANAPLPSLPPTTSAEPAAPDAAPAAPPVSPAPPIVPPVAANPSPPSKPEVQPSDTQVASARSEKTPTTQSYDIGAPEARDVSNYLLGVTCWVVTYYKDIDDSAAGSGSLVDRENKLVLTNFHVVEGHVKKPGRPIVFFPIRDKSQVVNEKDKYEKWLRRNDGISWHVEWYDKKKDLALIKLVEVPEGVNAVRIARLGVDRGDRVHSMGNPGASGALWVYSQGDVRAVYDKQWVSSGGEGLSNHSARVVETSSPVNPGDSGGPMVNDKKELIAVTQGKVVDPRGGTSLISYFIDVSEVRGFMKSYYDAKKLKPPPGLDTDPANEPTTNSNIAGLMKSLEDADAGRRAAAAINIGRFGRDGKPAIEALLNLRKDKDETVRKNAMEALEQVGGLSLRHLPRVLEGLKDASPDVRAAALAIIRLMAGEAESAADNVIELLKNDKDAIVRRKAAGALGAINASKSAVPVLAVALRDESAGVRSDAAEALAKQGAASAPAIKELGEALKDSQQNVRIHALNALEAIGGEAKTAVPQIQKALRERDKETRLAAVSAVAAIRAEDKDTVKCLVELLEEKDYRTPVNDALVRIGKGTVPTLNLELNNPKPQVRLGVVQALEQLGADARPALPNLIRLGQVDADAEVRVAAAKAAITIQKKVTGRP